MNASCCRNKERILYLSVLTESSLDNSESLSKCSAAQVNAVKISTRDTLPS